MGQGRWALARCSRGAAGPWPEAGPCWSSRGQRVRAPAARRTRGTTRVGGLTAVRDPVRRAAEHCRGGEERAAPAMGVPDPGGDGRRRRPAKGIERETMREQRHGEGATKRDEDREGGLVLVVVGVARWWRSTRSGAPDREEDKVHRRRAGARSSGRLAVAGNKGMGVMQIGHRARQGGGERKRGMALVGWRQKQGGCTMDRWREVAGVGWLRLNREDPEERGGTVELVAAARRDKGEDF